MTNMKPNEKRSLHSVELLLPWHAVDTLNSRDAGEVEKTLGQEGTCPPLRLGARGNERDRPSQ
jgi:hypothetical protein